MINQNTPFNQTPINPLTELLDYIDFSAKGILSEWVSSDPRYGSEGFELITLIAEENALDLDEFDDLFSDRFESYTAGAPFDLDDDDEQTLLQILTAHTYYLLRCAL